MLKKILHHKKEAVQLALLILLLALIRNYENELFYDPLLDFFKGEYQLAALPSVEPLKLFAGLGFRYFLNTVVSLLILYVIFKQKELVKLASYLYVIFFILLVIAFFVLLHFYSPERAMMLFYVRRFLIQPFFLLLFLPAFYYQKQFLKK